MLFAANEVMKVAQAEMMLHKKTTMSKALVRIPVERVEKAILLVRGEKVILDSDLAALLA